MITVDTTHAKLIAAELINLGLGFTVDAKPNTTERQFVIHAQGRDNLIREIAAVVAERLARAQMYTTESAELFPSDAHWLEHARRAKQEAREMHDKIARAHAQQNVAPPTHKPE